MNLSYLERKLQKADRKQAVLYLFCNFVSLMLITAYSAMMLSPTVQNIFPEGGDSRKLSSSLPLWAALSLPFTRPLYFSGKNPGSLGFSWPLGRPGAVWLRDSFMKCLL